MRFPGILRPVFAVLLTVGLLSLTPLATTSAAGADCRAIPLVPFGTPPTASGGVPDEDGKWCALVTTTAAGPYIVNGSAQVFGPGDDWVEPDYSIEVYGYEVFHLDAGTTYRLELHSSDLVAVHDGLGGGGCPTLTDTSWAAPREVEGFVGGRLVCRQFTAPGPNAVIRLNADLSQDSYEEQLVIDGDGDTVCSWRWGTHIECALDEGPGPYRLIVGAQAGAQSDVSVVDVSSTTGCTPITTMEWSTSLPSYTRDAGVRWDCFSYHPAGSGRHLMRTLRQDPNWTATYELWRVGDGQVESNTTDDTAQPNAYLRLDQADDYRIVIKGKPAAPAHYRLGVFDLARQTGCQPATGTGWRDAPMTGTTANGGIDCYGMTAQPGEKFRLQVERQGTAGMVYATVTDGHGDLLCGTNAPFGHWSQEIGVCRISETGPYRALVGQDVVNDEIPADRSYALYLTEADSGGCQPVELAAWNQALPIVSQADGSAYHCYSLTTGPGRYHRLSTWSESEYWVPRWELWEAGTVDQTAEYSEGTGLPWIRGDLSLEPSSSYRLVVSGDAADASGEYRAGLFDVTSSAGCPVIADLSWSSPPVVGEVSKGELDCRQLPASVATGDVVLREFDPFFSRITDVNAYDCNYERCEIEGQGPWRMVTEAGFEGDGSYSFHVNDPTDTTGCQVIGSGSMTFEAPPVTADLAPRGWTCYAVDLDEGSLFSRFSAGLASANAVLFDDLGRDCALGVVTWCYSAGGRQAVVVDNVSDAPADLSLLLREETSSSLACESMRASQVGGSLSGLHDEECFTFTPAAGAVFSVQSAGGPGGVAPVVRLFGKYECSYPAQLVYCHGDGSPIVLSVINESAAAGDYGVKVTAARARFVAQPQLQGRPVVGSVLAMAGGLTEPSDASWSVNWLRDGVVVGTGRSYRLTPADAGKLVRPRLTVRRPGYLQGVVTQPGIRVQKGTIAYAGTYATSGRPQVGQTLRAPVARSKVKPTGVKVSYQWFRGATAIRGATSAAYRLTAADRGRPVTCRAVLKKSGYVDRRLRTGQVRVR